MKKMATFVHLNEKHKLSEMNQLNVRKIASAAACKAAEVPALLDCEGIGFQQVECVNWAEDYPYKPAVSFRMAYTDDALLIHYRVSARCGRTPAWSFSLFQLPTEYIIIWSVTARGVSWWVPVPDVRTANMPRRRCWTA